MSDSGEHTLASGAVVAQRYRVSRVIGGGGMKAVYLVSDLHFASRFCALAEMIDPFRDPIARQNAVEAFRREAEILIELDNPHIPRVYDQFTEGKQHFLVMEFVDGDTLEKRIGAAPHARLDEPQVVGIAVQILSALEYLHRQTPPIIHRDLKPSNVMTTRSGLIKLIDFGIARHFTPQAQLTMIGTQGYAPPEQYRGHPEPRSDLYGVAVMMHQALTGRDPALEPPCSFPPIQQLRPELNPAVAAVINAALSNDIEKRPASASDFKRSLVESRIVESAPVLTGDSSARTTGTHEPSAVPWQRASAPAANYPTAAKVGDSDAYGKCSGCGSKLGSSDAFCGECGKPALSFEGMHSASDEQTADQSQLCPGCGVRLYSVDSRWCTRCGKDISSESFEFRRKTALPRSASSGARKKPRSGAQAASGRSRKTVSCRPKHSSRTGILLMRALIEWPFALVFCGLLGLLLFTIPVLGWLLGPLFWIYALFYPVIRVPVLREKVLGTCPVCGNEFEFENKNPPSKCPSCRTEFQKTNGTLFTLDPAFK
jgi:serine/threonine protein kinase